MSLSRNRKLTIAAVGMFAGVSAATLQACDDGPGGKLLEQCGLVCPSETLVEGNASISGVASVDAFFGAVLTVRDVSANLNASIEAEIMGIAGSIGIDTTGMGVAEAAAAINAEMSGFLSAYIDVNAGLTVKAAGPKCEANLDVAVEAAAECDVNVEPGMIEASCEGTCEVSAEVAAMCEAEGTLRCEGQAPNFACEGTCSGTCQLEASAECGGTCNGTCSGECSACVGGNCETDMMGNVTNCAGSCSAMCQGSCELEAGGSCSGRCEGSCEYTPPSGGCEANATAKCDASASANVECSGKCEGSVTPPEVSAECEASVNAKANAEIECSPPSLDIEFTLNAAAAADADLQAEFRVWLKGFKARYAALLAATARIEFVLAAAGEAGGAGVAAVQGSVDAALSGDLSLKASVGLGCALDELAVVATMLEGVATDLNASVSAVGMVSGSVGYEEVPSAWE